MTWQRVTDLADLPIGTTAHAELDEPVCVVRVDDRTVYAVHDVCSHQHYELHEGWVEDGSIECALHGSSFDLRTGKPDSLPAVQPIPTYATRIADGAVWVDIEQQTNDAPVPRH